MVKVPTTEELKAAFDDTVSKYNGGTFDDYFSTMRENLTYYMSPYSEPFVGRSAVRGMYLSFLN